MTNDAQITQLLKQADEGEPGAMDRVIELVHSDLRQRAAAHIRRRYGVASAPLTLQPTALVNEAYLKLLGQRTRYANRDHFLAIATRLMLRVLVDYQRARLAEKRGGGQVHVTLTGLGDDAESPVSDLAAALERLEAHDERKANVVKLRAVWGFEMSEIAEALEVSLATVERDWRFSKNWLATELEALP